MAQIQTNHHSDDADFTANKVSEVISGIRAANFKYTAAGKYEPR